MKKPPIVKFILFATILMLVSTLIFTSSEPRAFSQNPFTPTPSGTATLQTIQSDDALVERNGNWTLQNATGASGGSYLYSSGSPDDILTLTFEGSFVEVIYVESSALGVMAIEVDNTVLRTIITTNSETHLGASSVIDYLETRTHTLRIYASSGIIAVDAFYTTSAVNQSSSESNTALLPNLTGMPLQFVPNVGQTDEEVLFHTVGAGSTTFFTDDEVVIVLPNSNEASSEEIIPWKANMQEFLEKQAEAAPPSVTRLRFEGINSSSSLEGLAQLPGKVNYLFGDNPANWQTNLPTFSAIVYQDLYPGVDLYYAGSDGLLTPTYSIDAGADISQIRWRYAEASNLQVDKATGELTMSIATETTTSQRSVDVNLERREVAMTAWQEKNGRSVNVETDYVIYSDGSVGLSLTNYDPTVPLMISPETSSEYDVAAASGQATLIYNTYLGGGLDDYGMGIDVDTDGNAYVVGITHSYDFPTVNPQQSTCADPGGQCYDTFVTKVSADGSSLLYSTYLGGSGLDWGNGIEVGETGNAYIVGTTGSDDFPTINAYQPDIAYDPGSPGFVGYDAFVIKLNPAGNSIIFGTYFGDIKHEYGNGITLDDSGNAYIIGTTTSFELPGVEDGFQDEIDCDDVSGCQDAFVAKFSSSGSSLIYSTYLGGTGWDEGYGIAVDSEGYAYVAGMACASMFGGTFPQVNDLGLYPQNASPIPVAFVAKVNQSGGGLVYSTMLGGPFSNTYGYDVAIDSEGNAYVVGRTSLGYPFPTTPNALQPTYGGAGWDGFISKLTFSGTQLSLVYSSYLGGTGWDTPKAVEVYDPFTVYVTGETDSTDFYTIGGFQTANAGGRDAFLTLLNPLAEGSDSLIYSSYLGGSNDDGASDVATDEEGYPYIAGTTLSNDFPVTQLAFQLTQGGGYDAFIAKDPSGNDCLINLEDTEVSIYEAPSENEIPDSESLESGYSGFIKVIGRYRAIRSNGGDTDWYSVKYDLDSDDIIDEGTLGWISPDTVMQVSSEANVSCLARDKVDEKDKIDGDGDGELDNVCTTRNPNYTLYLYRAPIKGNPLEAQLPYNNLRILRFGRYAVDPVAKTLLYELTENSTQNINLTFPNIVVNPDTTEAFSLRWINVKASDISIEESISINGESIRLLPIEPNDTSLRLTSRITDSDLDENNDVSIEDCLEYIMSASSLFEPPTVPWAVPPAFATYPISSQNACSAGRLDILGLGADTGVTYDPPDEHIGVDFFVQDEITTAYVYSVGNGIVAGIGMSTEPIYSAKRWGGTELSLNKKGYSVIIRYGNLYVLYGHLAILKPEIYVGSKVDMGDPIGILGDNGHTHLHLEIRNFGNISPFPEDAFAKDEMGQNNIYGILAEKEPKAATNLYDITQFFSNSVLDPIDSSIEITGLSTGQISIGSLCNLSYAVSEMIPVTSSGIRGFVFPAASLIIPDEPSIVPSF